MMSTATQTASTGSNLSVNRAKQWQIALFPFNNAATNVYFAFYSYFTYFAVFYLTGSAAGALATVALTAAITVFTSVFVPLMRVFDGITDPIIGGLMDRTKTKFGKFRPFMVIGNVILALSVLLMMVFFRGVQAAWFRWIIYILSYIVYVIGYTCQCAVTKAGQTCLTNDPKQRSQFVIWNMVGMIGSIVLVNVMAGGVLTNDFICAKGLLLAINDNGVSLGQILYNIGSFKESTAEGALSIAEITAQLSQNGVNTSVIAQLEGILTEGQTYTFNLSTNAYASFNAAVENVVNSGTAVDTLFSYNYGAAYGNAFYNIMVPFVIIVSGIYTAMAVAAIAEKDKPEFWGVSSEPAKFKDYINIVKENKPLRWLVLSSGCNKLASTVATSGTVAFLVYGCLMGDYNGLYIPFYALSFVFMAAFFLWGNKVAGKKGQKRGVAQFTIFAFLFYIGIVILLAIWDKDNIATHLSLFSTEGGFHLTINAYTVIFIVLYGCGYGAFNVCDNLTIPMVADCTDYETYRSGKYVPGIMGTIFSLVDKIISSLQVLLLQLFIVLMNPNVTALPVEGDVYQEGMQVSAIICFCLLPMIAWLITTFCMTKYGLSGRKLEEVQAVNSVRKAAVKGGMSMEEAMSTWQSIDQVPAVFVNANAEDAKENVLDKIYNKVFTKHEQVTSNPPSSNAIYIPEQYLTEEVKAQMAGTAQPQAAEAPVEEINLGDIEE